MTLKEIIMVAAENYDTFDAPKERDDRISFLEGVMYALLNLNLSEESVQAVEELLQELWKKT